MLKKIKWVLVVLVIAVLVVFVTKNYPQRGTNLKVNNKTYNEVAGTLDGSKTGDDIVKSLSNGINLGNTFDVTDSKIGTTPSTEILQTGWGTKSLVWQDQKSGELVVDTDLIDALYNKGIRSIRIPCSWDYHVNFKEDADGNFSISKIEHNKGDVNKDGFLDEYDYFEKVDKLISYIIGKGMYVILDIHHPYTTTSSTTGLRENSWEDPVSKNYDSAIKKIEVYWKFIAEYYKKYDEHLVFELFNEIRDRDASLAKDASYNYSNAYEWAGKYGWSSNSKVISQYFKILNDYNAVAVNSIRNTGANNKYRLVVIPTYANGINDYAMKYVYSSIKEASGTLEEPYTPSSVDDNDSCDKNSSFCHKDKIKDKYSSLNDKYLAVALHAYTPNSFAQNSSGDVEYSDDVKNQLNNLFQSISNELTNYDIPVLITEFGAINKDNTQDREKYVNDYVKYANDYGHGLIKVFWWDAGTPFLKGSEAYSVIDRTLTKNNDHEKALNSYMSFVNTSGDIFRYNSNLYALNSRTNIVNQSVDWDFNNILKSLTSSSSDSSDGDTCKNKINISFIVDDAYSGNEDLISKINSYGYKAGLAVFSDLVDAASDGLTNGYLNWDRVKKIDADGNEILSHGVSSDSNVYWSSSQENGTVIDVEDASKEAVNSKSVIENKIEHGITGFVVPNNILDDERYNTITKAFYKQVYGSSDNKGVVSRTQYSAISNDSSVLKNVSDFKNNIEKAVASGTNTVYYFRNDADMPTSDLESILEYLSSNSCVTVVKPANLNKDDSGDDDIDLSSVKVKIADAKKDLYVGDKLSLKASVTGVDDAKISWRVNDNNLANLTQDNDGVEVEALKSGTALVTAYITINGVEISDTVTLKIADDSITIISNTTEDNLKMQVGDEFKLEPTVKIASGNAYTISYKSDNTNILDVDANGIVKAKAEGVANVKIIVMSKRNDFVQTEEVSLSVKVEKVKNPLTIQCDDISLTVDDTKKVDVLVNAQGDYKLKFKILDESIATVSDDGVVTGVKEGTTKLNITLISGEEQISSDVNVRVFGKKITSSIKLDKENISLYNGDSSKLTATITPSNDNAKVEWSSSNTEVVKVDSEGTITALANGSATVSASVVIDGQKYQADCVVKVLANPVHFKDAILYKNYKLKVGDSEKIQIKDEFLDSKIDYVSSDDSILKVDSKGVVTAIKSGSANVVATLEGTNISSQFDFVVYDDQDKNSSDDTSSLAASACRPKITYSTINDTVSKVIAVVNFEDSDCSVVNNNNMNTKVFYSNGEFVFRYTKDNVNYGEIKASVNWIKDINDGSILNPKTGSAFIYIIMMILGLSIGSIIWGYKKYFSMT